MLLEAAAVIGLLILFAAWRKPGRDPYADKPIPEEKSKPDYLSDDVKNNWQMVFSNDDFIAYFDSTSSRIRIYQVSNSEYRDELDNDGDDPASLVKEWYENLFGYPYVALDDGDVIVVWNGNPALEFKSKATGEVLYEYKDEMNEEPYSRESASYIAEQELPTFRKVMQEISYE